MKAITKGWMRFAALAAALGFGSALAQQCEDPKVLRFSIIPTQESVRELTLYKPVLDLLGNVSGTVDAAFRAELLELLSWAPAGLAGARVSPPWLRRRSRPSGGGARGRTVRATRAGPSTARSMVSGTSPREIW